MRDPYEQRETERAADDDEYARADHLERADRAIEKGSLGQHLEVLADALAAPGRRAPVGFDPADGGRVVTAPVREYRCYEHPERPVFSLPKKVTDQAGVVVGYHYPVADGPYCLICNRLMRPTHGEVI